MAQFFPRKIIVSKNCFESVEQRLGSYQPFQKQRIWQTNYWQYLLLGFFAQMYWKKNFWRVKNSNEQYLHRSDVSTKCCKPRCFHTLSILMIYYLCDISTALMLFLHLIISICRSLKNISKKYHKPIYNIHTFLKK